MVWFIFGLGLGFGLGFIVAFELGRAVHNKKMEEIHKIAQEMEDKL